MILSRAVYFYGSLVASHTCTAVYKAANNITGSLKALRC